MTDEALDSPGTEGVAWVVARFLAAVSCEI